MRSIIEGPPETATRIPVWRRIGWFFGLAMASAAVTALVAYGLKALLPSH